MNINGIVWAIILCCFLGGNLALGQTSVRSSEELTGQISVGDQVRVTDDSGNTITGKVEQISSASLMLKGSSTALSAKSIQQIQKGLKDPWWNGFLIGGGIGTAIGLLVAKSQCQNDSECSAIASVIFIPAGAAMGMATGAIIDRSMIKYDTVFTSRSLSSQSRFQIAPIISQNQKGLSLSIVF